MKYVIGLDYGSDSARAIIVNAETGEEISSSVKYYSRWMDGKYSDPVINQYRQHPQDYIDVLVSVVKEALSKCRAEIAENIVGMAFDTTGSTPVFTDKNGTPLSLLPEFAENPNAMFVLWKDHTAIEEAQEINDLSSKWDIDYTSYEGGIYSSEWFWSKVLHILRVDEKVRKAAYSIVEHCDWMPALITGTENPAKIYRSRCASGHKAMWLEQWDGLPSEEFLTTLDPVLAGFRDRLYSETYTSNTKIGYITEEWAMRLGLTTNVAVSVGSFDAHIGAVGVEVKPGALVKIIGTSTCDIMVSSYEEMKGKLISGICGQVDGSVIPGMIGLEAGQSAFGDVYAWFKNVIAWPLVHILSKSILIDETTKQKLIDETMTQIIPALSVEAAKISPAESVVLATDWMNGRRTPDANPKVKGTITGLSLGSSAPLIFRSLVEATAYGSKAIVEHFIQNKVEIKEIIGIGGIALKSPFVMQTLADVLNMPIKVAKTDQPCAFGSAMFAAVAAGIYDKIEDAQRAMSLGFVQEYIPVPENANTYQKLYEKYLKLGKFTEKELFC